MVNKKPKYYLSKTKTKLIKYIELINHVVKYRKLDNMRDLFQILGFFVSEFYLFRILQT